MEAIRKRIVALRWFRIPFTFGEELNDAELTNDYDSLEGHDDGYVVQSTSYNGFISSVQLFYTLTIIFAVFILSSYVCEKIDICLTLSVMMGVGVATMVYIFAFRKRFASRRTAELKTASERDNAAVIGLVTFCLLGSIHDFTHIVSTAIHCGPVFKTCKELFTKQVFHVTYHVVSVIYGIGQTIFCWTFNPSTFSNRCATRHGLVILQSVNVSLLFHALAEAAWEDYVHYTTGNFDEDLNAIVNECVNKSNASTTSAELTNCFIRNNSELAWYNDGTGIVRSFRIEFTLLAGECLAHLFSTCSSLGKHCPDTGTDASYDDQVECASRNSLDDSPPLGRRRRVLATRERRSATSTDDQASMDTTPLLGLKVTSSLIIRTLIFAVILLNIALLVSLFFLRFMLHYLCIYMSLVTLSIALGYHFSRNFRTRRHLASFTGFDRLFLLSASASLASNLLLLSAIIGRNRPITGFNVDAVDYVVCILQVAFSYFQVVFVLYSARVEPDARDTTHGLVWFRGVVLCLAISNGVVWFKDTFLDRFFAYERKSDALLRDVFGIYVWTILNNVLRPVEHFFLFTSCILLVKVYFRLQPKHQRSLGP